MWPQSRSSKAVWKCRFFRVLHQVDGVVVGAAAQEREEVAHPVGDAEAEHVAIEVGAFLALFDEERDVAGWPMLAIA